jgi:hypothetical protein
MDRSEKPAVPAAVGVCTLQQCARGWVEVVARASGVIGDDPVDGQWSGAAVPDIIRVAFLDEALCRYAGRTGKARRRRNKIVLADWHDVTGCVHPATVTLPSSPVASQKSFPPYGASDKLTAVIDRAPNARIELFTSPQRGSSGRKKTNMSLMSF